MLREWPAELHHLVMIVNIDGEERTQSGDSADAHEAEVGFLYPVDKLCSKIPLSNSLSASCVPVHKPNPPSLH